MTKIPMTRLVFQFQALKLSFSGKQEIEARPPMRSPINCCR
ncbi:unnamed protein product [Rhodiola kirilowii]